VGRSATTRRRVLIARGAVVAVLVASAVLGLSACSSTGGRRALLIGDSLIEESQASWQDLARSDGWDPREMSYGGTAPCDFFDRARQAVDDFDPQVVAIAFLGNALTPCMKHRDGSPLTSDEVVAKYRTDLQRLIDIFGPQTAVYLVGAPQTRVPSDGIVDVSRELAAELSNVEYIDGGALISPDRTYADTQPCLLGEQCTGPVVGGVPQNVVRNTDGIHFCPVDHQPGQPCPVYASGAFRYARTIFEGMGGQSPP
jgi:hypothetical protein